MLVDIYDTSVCYSRCIKVHVDETAGGTKANQRERERVISIPCIHV